MTDKLTMHTRNLVQDNVEKIGSLFPSCIIESVNSEGKLVHAIDFEALKRQLSEDILEDGKERYVFTWPGKSEAQRLANVVSTSTLRPIKEKSLNYDHTGNLYIEGDNLEVLKLLRETYLNRIKVIYIDPPYNTGHDLIYNDSFSSNIEQYSIENGDYDENDNLLVVNPDSSGRFHTNWLNMMYPRLVLCRDLLSSDGVIFISIDDNEVENLRKICDEIFGECNFISQLVLVNNIAGRSDSRHIATAHEYILMYQKSDDFVANGLPLSKEQLAEYKFHDEGGAYRLQGLRKRGSHSLRTDRPNLWYPVYYSPSTNKVSLDKNELSDVVEITPKLSDGTDGCWRWGKDTFLAKKEYLLIRKVSGRGEYDVFEKVYPHSCNDLITRSS